MTRNADLPCYANAGRLKEHYSVISSTDTHDYALAVRDFVRAAERLVGNSADSAYRVRYADTLIQGCKLSYTNGEGAVEMLVVKLHQWKVRADKEEAQGKEKFIKSLTVHCCEGVLDIRSREIFSAHGNKGLLIVKQLGKKEAPQNLAWGQAIISHIVDWRPEKKVPPLQEPAPLPRVLEAEPLRINKMLLRLVQFVSGLRASQ